MKKAENAAQARPTMHSQSITVIIALVTAFALTFAIAIIPSAHAVEGVTPLPSSSVPTGPAVPIQFIAESASAQSASAQPAPAQATSASIADEETPLASFAKEDKSNLEWIQWAVLSAALVVVVACSLMAVKRRRDSARDHELFESHVTGR